jgi:hypothetical protein
MFCYNNNQNVWNEKSWQIHVNLIIGVSECCVTPNEQWFSYIVVRTKWAMVQLHRGENQMSNGSAISWWEPNEQWFSYIVVRTKWAMVQLHRSENQMSNGSATSWWEQVTFDELMSALYNTNTLSWICIVLAH